MTYDELSILKSFSDSNVLPYPLLRDENVKHVSAYNIRNMDYEEGHRGYGIPHPGIVYLDANGLVRAKFAEPGYKKRPAMKLIYKALSGHVKSP